MTEISSAFQRRAMNNVCHVPGHLKCPCCRHGYDIVVSRRQVLRGYWMRRLFRFFRCRVCGCRFRTINVELILRPMRVAIPALAIPALAVVAATILNVTRLRRAGCQDKYRLMYTI